MTTSSIAIPYRPGSDLLKPRNLRQRAKVLSREDGAAGADGLHGALSKDVETRYLPARLLQNGARAI